MTRWQIFEVKAFPLCLYELSQGDQRTTAGNEGTMESPFEGRQACATQQKDDLYHFMMAESLHVHWTHWETLLTTKQALHSLLGRLSYIFNKEPFTFQLISKWYSPECADWMGLLKSSLPSQALYQREKWGLGRCLDLPKVTVLQRYSFHSAWSLTQRTFPSKSSTSFCRQKPTWGNSSECYPLNHSFTPNPNLSVSIDDKLFLPQRAHSFFTLCIFQVFYPMFRFRANYIQRQIVLPVFYLTKIQCTNYNFTGQ